MSSHQLPIFSSEIDFENAVCDLFNSLNEVRTFKQYGRKGTGQKGIDIYSPDLKWAIQCKKKDITRTDKVLKAEIIQNIKSDFASVKNGNVLEIKQLYFVTTFKDHPEFDNFCNLINETERPNFEIIFWGWDTLSSKFLNYPDLLSKYWPKFIITPNQAEHTLKRNLELKRQIKVDFSDWLNFDSKNRTRNSSIILRAFDSSQYPYFNEEDIYGEYSWFRAEIKSLYHLGLEFIIGLDEILVNEDGTWTSCNQNSNQENYVEKVAKVGQVNFSEIVNYDIEGDEHYNYPHIYCNFKYNGTPFENIYYMSLDNLRYFELEDKYN